MLRLLGDPFKVGGNVQVAAADKDGINAVFRDLSHIRSDVQLTAVVAVNVHQAQGVRLIAVTVAGQDRQRDLFVVLRLHKRFVRHYRAALHIVDENEALIVAFAETRRNQHVRGRHREGDRVGGGMRNVRNGVDIFSAEFILHQDRPGRGDQSAVGQGERGDGIALIDPGVGAEIFQINAAVIGRRIVILRFDPEFPFFTEGRRHRNVRGRHHEGVPRQRDGTAVRAGHGQIVQHVIVRSGSRGQGNGFAVLRARFVRRNDPAHNRTADRDRIGRDAVRVLRADLGVGRRGVAGDRSVRDKHVAAEKHAAAAVSRGVVYDAAAL